MRRDYTDYLQDMLDYTAKAERWVANIDFEEFRRDEEKTLAVVRALEIIGEAARHIPRTLRAKYPDIPWEDIIGMRSKLAHDYFGVDLAVVWRTAREDLTPLRIALTKILGER